MKFENIMISIVDISDDLINKVANHCMVDKEIVLNYIKSDKQDNNLLKAFLYFGIGPIGKRFRY
jgi:hypothetical protein